MTDAMETVPSSLVWCCFGLVKLTIKSHEGSVTFPKVDCSHGWTSVLKGWHKCVEKLFTFFFSAGMNFAQFSTPKRTDKRLMMTAENDSAIGTLTWMKRCYCWLRIYETGRMVHYNSLSCSAYQFIFYDGQCQFMPKTERNGPFPCGISKSLSVIFW